MVDAELERFFQEEQGKDLLRLTTAGSVDDGKSTLIGRLLYDSQSVYEDQLQSVSRASATRGKGTLDLSLLTDGLRAEREQGITIDVAYRYFATPKRKFILADTPGHVQYTRNMATGASTAELAIVLLDIRRGVQEQSRRHAYILSLLGISHLVVAVNKMDLVGYDGGAFTNIQREFSSFLEALSFEEVYWVPISALAGDNIVERSRHMPWFEGSPVLEYLENVEVRKFRSHAPFRFPVQRVARPNLDFRGYSGSISSGTVHRGDKVTVLPGARVSRIKSITTYDGELELAYAPMPVTLQLEDEIDISRGDLICSTGTSPKVARAFEAKIVWFGERPLELGYKYLFKHTTRFMRAEIRSLRYRLNIQSFAQESAETLHMNDVGVAEIETTQELFFDPYAENRLTGSAVIIDPESNFTVGAVMLVASLEERQPGVPSAASRARVASQERVARFGHRPAVLNFAGRERLAYLVERRLFENDARVIVLGETEGQSIAALADAGFIVLSVAGSAKATLSLPMLPESDDEAVERVLDLLLEANILSKAQG